MAESNLVPWGAYDPKVAQAEAEEVEKMGGGDYMKLGVGKNVIRILPPKVGQKTPFAVTFQHYLELPGMSDAVKFNCPRKMGNQPCMVCSRADKLRNTGDPRDYDTAGNYMPKLRVYAVVLDRKDPDKGPRVLAFGKGIYEALVDLRTDEDAGGDYTHPMEGFDVIVTRKGTGKNDTEYKVNPARDSSALAEDMETIRLLLEQAPNLVRFMRVPTQRDILKMLRDAGADMDGLDEDDDEHTQAPPRRPRAAAAAAPKRRTAEQDAIDTDGEEVPD